MVHYYCGKNASNTPSVVGERLHIQEDRRLITRSLSPMLTSVAAAYLPVPPPPSPPASKPQNATPDSSSDKKKKKKKKRSSVDGADSPVPAPADAASMPPPPAEGSFRTPPKKGGKKAGGGGGSSGKAKTKKTPGTTDSAKKTVTFAPKNFEKGEQAGRGIRLLFISWPMCVSRTRFHTCLPHTFSYIIVGIKQCFSFPSASLRVVAELSKGGLCSCLFFWQFV